MPAFVLAVRFAVLAAFWRRFDPGNVSFRLRLLTCAMLALIGGSVLRDWVAGGPEPTFSLYAINATIATELVTLCAIALFSARFERLEETTTLVCLFALANLGLAAVAFGWDRVSTLWSGGVEPWATATAWIESSVGWLFCIWLVIAVRAVFVGWEGSTARRPLLRAAGVVAGLYAAYVLPLSPIFRPKDFDRTTANVWEMLAAYRDAKAEAASEPTTYVDKWAAVELAQPALLESSLRKVGVRQSDASNVFVLGLAGWGDQGVFLKEARESLNVLDQRFGTGFRSVLLANSDETVASTPMASLPNLAAALTEIGRQMDPERDALMMVMTSHGSRHGFALSYGSVVRRLLNATDLKAALDLAGIRNRILVVSACYSGTFVPVLADEDTAIFTAASADTTSFGCSNEREWTYFGDAFFNRALRGGGSLTGAFAEAEATVRAWEVRDGITPSRPQIAVGSRIAARFPELLMTPDTAAMPRQAAAR